MSAFDDHKDELQHYEQMLGTHRGRLAVTLDRVTNAMVLVGQHGVYCHSQRDPSKPTMDIQIITDELRKAKELIQSVMEDFGGERGNRLRANKPWGSIPHEERIHRAFLADRSGFAVSRIYDGVVGELEQFSFQRT